MTTPFSTIAALFLLNALVLTNAAITYNGTCVFSTTTNETDLTIAGSIYPVHAARIWSKHYPCPTLNSSNIEHVGSTIGARRACGKIITATNTTPDRGPVDIGATVRQLNPLDEIKHEAGFWKNTGQGRCNLPNHVNNRRVREIEIGHYAVSVAVAVNSFAHKCIQELGGLTVEQVRWIFSSVTEKPSAAVAPNFWIPARDSPPDSRFWSDLSAHPNCKQTEIQLFGPDLESKNGGVAHGFFTNAVRMNKPGETIATQRQSGMTYFSSSNGTVVAAALAASKSGIGVLQGPQESKSLSNVAIQFNSTGLYVAATPSSIRDQSYPLSTKLYAQVHFSTLFKTFFDPNTEVKAPRQLQARDFLQFALSDAGTEVLPAGDAGFVTLDEPRRRIMLCRLKYTEYCKEPLPCRTKQAEYCDQPL